VRTRCLALAGWIARNPHRLLCLGDVLLVTGTKGMGLAAVENRQGLMRIDPPPPLNRPLSRRKTRRRLVWRSQMRQAGQNHARQVRSSGFMDGEVVLLYLPAFNRTAERKNDVCRYTRIAQKLHDRSQASAVYE
jgi:hypothetical protein